MSVPTRLESVASPVINRSAEVTLLNAYVPGLAQYLQGRPVAATLHLSACVASLASVAWTGSWSIALGGTVAAGVWSLVDGLWYERRRRRSAVHDPA